MTKKNQVKFRLRSLLFLVALSMITQCVWAHDQASANCPAVGSQHVTMTMIKGKAVYSAKLEGQPGLELKSDNENKGPATKFDMMMVTPMSPYFVSCWYNKGAFVLKTQKGHFYNTDRTGQTCRLESTGKNKVQTTSVASICVAKHAAECRLVCK